MQEASSRKAWARSRKSREFLAKKRANAQARRLASQRGWNAVFAGRKPANRPVGIRETFFSAHYVQKTVWVFSGNLYTPGMSSEHADAQIAPQAPVPAGGNGADNGAADIPPKALGMRVGAVRTPLGVLLGGAAVVLALMVGLLAFISIDRSEAAMARLLAEKGSSLIMAFESILRSGMRSEAGVRLQVLLEEMAASPDILFVAVTMPDGTIVAHSKRAVWGKSWSWKGESWTTCACMSLRRACPRIGES